jgi:hypothetical protein
MMAEGSTHAPWTGNTVSGVVGAPRGRREGHKPRCQGLRPPGQPQVSPQYCTTPLPATPALPLTVGRHMNAAPQMPRALALAHPPSVAHTDASRPWSNGEATGPGAREASGGQPGTLMQAGGVGVPGGAAGGMGSAGCGPGLAAAPASAAVTKSRFNARLMVMRLLILF